MPGTNLGFPFDAEIFSYQWKNQPDVISTAIINSGAMVNDSEIAGLISSGSNFFTVPFYDVLGGDEQVYNGVNDFTLTELTGGSYSGVVYGRMKAWMAKSFIKDFNSGADPMMQIVSGVAKYWQKKKQTRLVGLLTAIFAITGDTDWEKHLTDIATATPTVDDSNLIGPTTINDAIVKACGDMAGEFTLAIMHSTVANRLAGLQLLEYSKYTDASGIQRALPLATVNGMTVVVSDEVGATKDVNDNDVYPTYVCGLGSIRYAEAPVDVPVEMDRDPAKNGGNDMIYTRVRETMHPAGFSYKGDVATDVGILDSDLLDATNWERKVPAKAIKLVSIKTNG